MHAEDGPPITQRTSDLALGRAPALLRIWSSARRLKFTASAQRWGACRPSPRLRVCYMMTGNSRTLSKAPRDANSLNSIPTCPDPVSKPSKSSELVHLCRTALEALPGTTLQQSRAAGSRCRRQTVTAPSLPVGYSAAIPLVPGREVARRNRASRPSAEFRISFGAVGSVALLDVRPCSVH